MEFHTEFHNGLYFYRYGYECPDRQNSALKKDLTIK